MTKIYLDKLHEPENAIRTLEDALHASGWADEDESFFLFRLVDLNLEHRHDHERAVELLIDVVERFPDSRHSANAVHRLRELDPAALTSLFGAEAHPAGAAEGEPSPLTPPQPSAVPAPDIVRSAPTTPRPDNL
jgi:hypothetical protein